MKTGVELIAAERERQITQEGWAPEHDDGHSGGEMALASVCYASPVPIKARLMKLCSCRDAECSHFDGIVASWQDPWPWGEECDKRSNPDRIRNLVKAGALIAAEIDRLQRIQATAEERK